MVKFATLPFDAEPCTKYAPLLPKCDILKRKLPGRETLLVPSLTEDTRDLFLWLR